jgi:lysophospholipase L1-like esterase
MAQLSRVLLCAVAALSVSSCGGSPTEPPTGTPPPEVFSVTVTVFEDTNQNGRIDSNETLWVPDVDVEVAGKVGRSEKRTGRTTITGVPRGTYPVSVRASSLPPYYVAGTMPTVDAPQTDTNIKVPVRVPIGTGMIPGIYFISGDSISQGEGSSTGVGIRPILQDKLLDHFGRGQVVYRGGGGDRTTQGAERLDRDLGGISPAYTILNWGVNDWHEPGCGNPTSSTCPATANYNSMIARVRSYGSLPCLSTLIPCNTNVPDQCPAARIAWVRQMNDLITGIARQQKILLVDTGGAFFKSPNVNSLFSDHVHPNDAGYQIIADAYYEALTHGVVSATSAGIAHFGFAAPGGIE